MSIIQIPLVTRLNTQFDPEDLQIGETTTLTNLESVNPGMLKKNLGRGASLNNNYWIIGDGAEQHYIFHRMMKWPNSNFDPAGAWICFAQVVPKVNGDRFVIVMGDSAQDFHEYGAGDTPISERIVTLNTATTDIRFYHFGNVLRTSSAWDSSQYYNRPGVYQWIDREFFGKEWSPTAAFYYDTAAPKYAAMISGTLTDMRWDYSIADPQTGLGNSLFEEDDIVIYKIVPIFDGNQEGIFDDRYVRQTNDLTADDVYFKVQLVVSEDNFNKRITHLKIYRARNAHGVPEASTFYHITTIPTTELITSGSDEAEFTGNPDHCFATPLAYDDDGDYLFSIDSENTYRLWILGGRPQFDFDAHLTYTSWNWALWGGWIDDGGLITDTFPAHLVTTDAFGATKTYSGAYTYWRGWYTIDDSDHEWFDSELGELTDANKLTESWHYGVGPPAVWEPAWDAGESAIYQRLQLITGQSMTKDLNGIYETGISVTDGDVYEMSCKFMVKINAGSLVLGDYSGTPKFGWLVDGTFYETQRNFSGNAIKVPGSDDNYTWTVDTWYTVRTFYVATATGTIDVNLAWVATKTGGAGIDIDIYYKNATFAKVSKSHHNDDASIRNNNTKVAYGEDVISIPGRHFMYDNAGNALPDDDLKGKYLYVDSQEFYGVNSNRGNTLQTTKAMTAATNVDCMLANYKWEDRTLLGEVTHRLTWNDVGYADGATHPLVGQTSIEVDYKYAQYLDGRQFVGNVTLDPTDANEEHKDWIIFSEFEQPDVLPVSNYITIEDLQGGEITGLETHMGRLVVFMEKGIYVLSIPSADPTSWELVESEENIGCIAPDSICKVEEWIFFAGYDHIYALTPNFQAVPISKSLQDDYQGSSTLTDTKIEYEMKRRQLLVLFGDDTANAYSFDIDQFLSAGTEGWAKLTWANVGGTSLPINYFATNEDLELYSITKNVPSAKTTIFVFRTTASNSETVASAYKTGWIPISKLDDDQIIRRLSVRCLAASPLTVTAKIYADGDQVTHIWSGTFAHTVRHQSLRVGRRARYFMIELTTTGSAAGFQLERLEVEIDD